MANGKSYAEVELANVGEPQKGHSGDDEADMRRMGKTQEFTVRNTLSTLLGLWVRS